MRSGAAQEMSGDFAELEAIVGPHWSGTPFPLWWRWGSHVTQEIKMQGSVEPGTATEVAQVLAWAEAQRLTVIPSGGGTKLNWGNPLRYGDLALQMGRLNHIIEHAWGDMTITVEAGCTISQVQQALAEHGQRLVIDPLWPDEATIGGVLATNDNGALRFRFGALRDLVLGMTVALADGTLAKSGGKVVKNVAGYDLQKLMTGAFGTLGVITSATFRVHPMPRAQQLVIHQPPSFDAMDRLLRAILNSTLTPAALTINAGGNTLLRVATLFEGLPEALAEQATLLGQLAGDIPVSLDTELLYRSMLFFPYGDGFPMVVARFAVLPDDLGQWLAEVQRLAQQQNWVTWVVEAQGTGTGHIQLHGPEDPLTASFAQLRHMTTAQGGSLVVLDIIDLLDYTLDVWGEPPAALSLMRRLKGQFDPAGILNPGRFVGGI